MIALLNIISAIVSLALNINKKMLNQRQDMYKNCVIIYKIIFKTLENKFQFSHCKITIGLRRKNRNFENTKKVGIMILL